jgi:hypothetical protein
MLGHGKVLLLWDGGVFAGDAGSGRPGLGFGAGRILAGNALSPELGGVGEIKIAAAAFKNRGQYLTELLLVILPPVDLRLFAGREFLCNVIRGKGIMKDADEGVIPFEIHAGLVGIGGKLVGDPLIAVG